MKRRRGLAGRGTSRRLNFEQLETRRVLASSAWQAISDQLTVDSGNSDSLVFVDITLDSSLETLLSFSVEKLPEIVPILVKYPQHHYFLEKDANWCLVFTQGGDMDFGFRPPQ